MRLVRSREDAYLGGVCGGLGAAFEIEPSILRVAFVILAFLTHGFAIALYLLLWLLLPAEGEASADLVDRVQGATEEMAQTVRSFVDRTPAHRSAARHGTSLLLGGALVIVGVAFLLRNLGVAWMGWFGFGTLWPLIPLLVGCALFWRWWKGVS